MKTGVRHTKHIQLMLVVAILLVAAALRSYHLADISPGVEHDEATEWQIARGILAGQHAIFSDRDTGRSQGISTCRRPLKLLGDNVFAALYVPGCGDADVSG